MGGATGLPTGWEDAGGYNPISIDKKNRKERIKE
jgi:hypothetical protein